MLVQFKNADSEEDTMFECSLEHAPDMCEVVVYKGMEYQVESRKWYLDSFHSTIVLVIVRARGTETFNL